MLLHANTGNSSASRLPAGESRIGFPSDWVDGGLAVLGPEGQVVEMNAALMHCLGCSLSELRGEPLVEALSGYCAGWENEFELLQRANGTFARARWKAPAVNGAPARWFEAELTRHNGVMVFRLDSTLPPLAGGQELDCERCVTRTSGARELFLKWARAEEQRNQLILRWPGIVFSQRPDGSFYFVSPKIEELTGIPVKEWQGSADKFWEVVHEADRQQVRAVLERVSNSNEAETATFRVRHAKSGKIAYVLEHRRAVKTRQGQLLGYEGLWLDLTRQKQVEERLNAAAWKETISALTFGLAHDFRNVMAGILGLTETFQAQLEEEHPMQKGLGLMRSSAWQATQSVQRILQLCRGKSGEKSYQDLNELVGEMSDLTRTLFSGRAVLETDLAEGQLPIYVDAFECRQAILNLAINALDAMPEGGQLTIQTSRHELLPPLGFVRGTPPRVPAVCLSMSDTGCGIPPQNLPRIFERFFTTKPLEKGSGLGLCNVLLFVERHHGAVSVESCEGQGSRFQLWLPEADFSEAP